MIILDFTVLSFQCSDVIPCQPWGWVLLKYTAVGKTKTCGEFECDYNPAPSKYGSLGVEAADLFVHKLKTADS
jgi:hypothetical protein